VPQAETLGGQITQVVFVVLRVGTLFFVLVTLTGLFVAGDLSGPLGARRMQSKVAELSDHYPICGLGRVERQGAWDLESAGVPFVVIDNNPYDPTASR
jgi:voltage-gated potassium channel